MKVLIVDDSEIDSLLCKNLVKSMGYQAVMATSAREALDILTSPDYPSLIIIDWMMPEMDGIELTKIIRNMNMLVNPFILLMSSSREEHLESQALIAGTDDFIQKPVNLIDLQAKITLGKRLISNQLQLLLSNKKLLDKTTENPVTGVLSTKAGLNRLTTELSYLSNQNKLEGLLIRYKINLELCGADKYRVDLKNNILKEVSCLLKNGLDPESILMSLSDTDFLMFFKHSKDEHNSVIAYVNRLVRNSINRLKTAESEFSILSSVTALKSEDCIITAEDLAYKESASLIRVSLNVDSRQELVYINNNNENICRILDFVSYKSTNSNA